jgi:hypothetical protein
MSAERIELIRSFGAEIRLVSRDVPDVHVFETCGQGHSPHFIQG